MPELRARLAPWNWFKPSSKLFYWPFQGGTSFVDLLCFFLSCVCFAFVRVCLLVPCGHLLGKGWPLGSRLWCITVSLSLSHWCPWSSVVLDCIGSWSLHPYLLWPIKYHSKIYPKLYQHIILLFVVKNHVCNALINHQRVLGVTNHINLNGICCCW